MPKHAIRNSLTMSELAEEWRHLCDIKKDVHVAYSADEGDGKSTKLVSDIKYVLGGDMWKNIIYSKNPKEFYDKYDNMEQGGVMGFDEALDLLDRMDWRNLNDMVKKFRGEVRKEKNGIFIYNVQLFRDLHSYWRNHRVRYWLEMLPRQWFGNKNIAVILNRQRVPFITGKRDTWMLDSQEKLWMDDMKTSAINVHEYIKKLRLHPFYRGEHKFKALSDHDELMYLKRRAEAKEIYEKDMDADKPNVSKLIAKWKGRFFTLTEELKEKKGFKQKDIAEMSRMQEKNFSRERILHKERLQVSQKT